MQCPTCHSTIDSEAAYCPFCGERVPDGPVYDEYDYEAFISYRHLPRDRTVAVKLQRRLEGMAIPRGIKTDDGRTKLGKLFRDEDELPTSSSLPDQIREALKRSRYLVVICSPETSESAWVQREVELFASFHGRSRVRIVLAAGEPDESFPTLLRSRLVVDENGDVISVEEEPLAADLRSDDRKRFRSESLRIAAPLIGCGYDDLVQRQHARRMRLIAIATSVVAAVSTAFGSFSLYQQRQIEHNYRLTQINQSESRAVQSQELLAAGSRMEAIEVALAALPESSTSGDRPFVPAAQIALADATYAYTPSNFWRSCYALKSSRALYAASDGGLQANMTNNGMVQISHVEDGLTTCTIDYSALFEGQGVPSTSIDSAWMSFCGEKLIFTSNKSNVMVLCDAGSGAKLWTADLRDIKGELLRDAIAASPDGSLVAAGIQQANDDEVPSVCVCLIDATTGERVQTFYFSLDGVDKEDVTEDVRLAFSPDGTSLAVSCSKTIWNVNLQNGKTASASLTQNDAYRLAYYDDVIVSVSAEDGAYLLLLGSSYYDVFTPDLELLWSKQETPAYHLDSHLSQISNDAFTVGTCTFADGTPILAYVAGNEVRLVNRQTGEQRYGLSLSSPVRAAYLIGSDGMQVVDRDGNLASYIISDSDTGGFVPYASMQVAEGDFASIIKKDKKYYATIWDSSSNRYRVYRSSRRTDGIAGYEAIEGLDGFDFHCVAGPSKGNPVITPVVMQNATQLCALDPETFQVRWTIQKDQLDPGNTVDTSIAGGRLYAYTSWDTSFDLDEDCVILELSWDTGEVINRYAFPRLEYSLVCISDVRLFTIDGAPALAVAVNVTRYVWCFSLEDLEPLGCVGPLDDLVSDFYQVGDLLIVAFEGALHGRFEVFQLKDGTPVESPLTSLTPAHSSNLSNDVAFSWDADRMLVCCADGYLRCLDTADWSVLWEQRMENVRKAAFTVDGRRILLQDTDGTCVLLDAGTGSTLRASSVKLPLINFFIYDPDDPARLDAVCPYQTLVTTEYSFISFSVDDETFGPTALVSSGIVPSLSRDKVLSRDAFLDEVGVQHLHTLDELIALGHEELQGHELTEVERQLLRIDE